MPISLVVLVALAVGAFATAAYAMLVGRWRADVLGRATADAAMAEDTTILDPTIRGIANPAQRALYRVASAWLDASRSQDQMVQAGWDSPTAPLTYATVRLVLLVTIPVATLILFSPPTLAAMLLVGAAAFLVAYALPIWYLMRRVRLRQEQLRRSLPDGLDLLVVCVEAGISIDAALLRVSREMRLVHPDLAHELTVVTRKTNAGVPREEALRGLWNRTGVEELRGLVSSMIQSEKWGTSIANVLRVYAESLRRKRRQIAEKKAATAPVKMLIPLVLFILPAMFIVTLGPAAMQISAFFHGRGHP